MSSARPASVRGFSLVELVIVIVIIGILAVVAIPRISHGARNAGEAALRSDLATLRHAIELYASEHNGVFPGAALAGAGFGAAGSENAFRNQLLVYTDADGLCAAARTARYCFGPYLRTDIPPLPVGLNKGSRRVSPTNTMPMVAVPDGTGWVYGYVHGEIIANADDPDAGGTTTYDQY